MGISITPAMKVTKNDGNNSETQYISFTDSIRVIKKDGGSVEGIFIRLNFDKVVIAIDDKPINIPSTDIETIEVIGWDFKN